MRVAERKWSTAVHEAAHVIVAHQCGLKVQSSTIIGDEAAEGHTISRPFPSWFDPGLEMGWRTRRRVEAEIMLALAGGLAERRLGVRSERRIKVGEAHDLEIALEIARRASRGNDEEAHAYLKWLRYRTEAVLASSLSWSATEALASRLIEAETLAGHRLKGAVDQSFARARESHGIPGSLRLGPERPNHAIILT
jgi:hypothetical protein